MGYGLHAVPHTLYCFPYSKTVARQVVIFYTMS